MAVFLGTLLYYSFQCIQFKKLKSGQLALFFVAEFCTSIVALKFYSIMKYLLFRLRILACSQK